MTDLEEFFKPPWSFQFYRSPEQGNKDLVIIRINPPLSTCDQATFKPTIKETGPQQISKWTVKYLI